MIWPDRFVLASRYLALCVAGIGLMVLVGGWGLDIGVLRVLVPGLDAMKANTALSLTLLGLSLWLARVDAPAAQRRWQRLPAAVVALLAALTLTEHLFGTRIGLDELLFADPYALSGLPGRMAPAMALNLLFGALALLWVDARPGRAQIAAALLVVGAALPLVGYSFGAIALYRAGGYGAVALHSALSCLLLGAGILAARPAAGFMAVVASEGAGGIVCRALLPALPGLIWLIAVLRLAGEIHGHYDTRVGLALMVTGSITVSVVAVLWVAARLDRQDTLRHQAEKARDDSEARFRLALEGAPHPELMVDRDGRITLVNAQAEALFGYSRQELVGQPVEVLVPQAIRAHHPDLVAGYVGAPQVRPLARGKNLSAVRKDGSSVPVEISLAPVTVGDTLEVLAVVIDISERRRMEAQLRAANEELDRRVVERTQQLETANRQLQQEIAERQQAEITVRAQLAENEVLLKEIHHRVKNNLQIVWSLLDLQGAGVADPAAAALADSQERVKSMALVHEMLYQTGRFAQIELGAYLERLAQGLLIAYRGDGVDLRLSCEPLAVDLDAAIPLALITNELVTNSLKYGFADGRNAELRIALTQEADTGVLRIGDNGVGLPAGLDVASSHSLGLQLVHLLAGQIGAELVVEPGPGARFRVKFPLTRQTISQ